MTSLFLAALCLGCGAGFAQAQVKAVITGDDHYVADHTGNPRDDHASVYLDGSQSEGDIVYWEWSAGGFTDFSGNGPDFAGDSWHAERGNAYPYTLDCYVGLYVEDAEGNSDYTEKTIYVEFRNQYTVADAGPDQSFFAPYGLDVTLDGSGYDPDGDDFWVADWWDMQEGNSYGYGDWHPTLFLFPGVHEFELWVWDPYAYDYCEDFGTDRVTVTIYGSWIDSLIKSSCYAGEFPTTITVTGKAFRKGAVITWNGQGLPTTWLSPTQLRTKLTADQVAIAGVNKIVVSNPDLDNGAPGGFSNTVDFTVLGRAPMISSLSPASVKHGSPGFTLNVTGTRFVPASVVYWNGAARATTYNSPTSLSIQVSAADVSAAGKVAVTVVSPPPGGGTSSVKTFTIK